MEKCEKMENYEFRVNVRENWKFTSSGRDGRRIKKGQRLVGKQARKSEKIQESREMYTQ